MIETKRKDLEKFIQEQMVGPGGCAWRFGKDGQHLGEEVLNTTPGSVYNTAILFPERSNVNAENQQQEIEDEVDVDVQEVIGEDDRDKDSDNSDQDADFSMGRRFPNAMAISCCLDGNVNLNQDVMIRVTGRYYRKIEGEERQRVYINNISENRRAILQSHLEGDELINNIFCLNDGRLYFRQNVNITTETRNNVLTHLNDLNRRWSTQIIEEVRNTEWGNDVFAGLNERYYFLSTCRRKLFEKLKKPQTELQHANEIKEKINQIGQYEQSILDLENLIDAYDNQDYGFWESFPIDWNVDLANVPFNDTRRSYMPNQDGCDELFNQVFTYNRRNNEDGQITMSLSVLLQVTKDYRNPDNGNKYLKVMLRNSTTPFVETEQDHYTIVNEELNKSCFFGMKIEVESEYIRPYRKGSPYVDVNSEEDRLKFLYRNIKDYGVGHLCSVDWNKQGNKVWSEFLPKQDVPDVDYTPRNKYVEWKDENGIIVPPPFLPDNNCLNLHRLSTFSDVNDNAVIGDLNNFVDMYQKWIDLLPGEGDFEKYTKNQCQIDCKRISENIQSILRDNNNLCSFRLMNSAMLMQMWHQEDNYAYIQQNEILTPGFYADKGMEYNWRPFQLAFILLNLDGIIQRDDDQNWEKRNELVDLVWFPTGGGKTEAYLGIIALTIINRRKKFENAIAGGTTVIMRYTLRLLATQQFERALKLILALDQIRIWGAQDEYENVYGIGNDAVSIGLFVGNKSLPNTYDELNEEAQIWNNRNNQQNVRTKIPLDKCPWCGGNLNWANRYANGYNGFQAQFGCQNDNCTFYGNRLPVHLCDQQIYADPPTLLFGTVDKFAQLARKVSTGNRSIRNDSRRLFGRGQNLQYLTPDLIIQDELHLLLGPLGSAVSLFETAIDVLCTRTVNNIEVRPKIISSTATTRNTELQIRALYDREINIFPKSGIDYDDSFFAFFKRQKVNNVEEWISKRRYIGIMPTGRTQMLMQLRLAAILFVHRAKFEKEHWQEGKKDDIYNSAADNYYSIISYFNSLKEVGKTDAQYPYEFTKYLQRLYLRVIGHYGLLDCFYAEEDTLKENVELTGRLSGAQVVSSLKEVQKSFNVCHRLPHQGQDGGIVRGSTPPDYILATNMISVGIDVSRFNTIIMNSMPRNIAEYIQASSRVARSVKGLVFTSHNPYRVRDISHYEKFIEFHEKMYYYVEPISITPFSNKAVEKFLPLCLATIIRHTIGGFQNNIIVPNNITQDDAARNLMGVLCQYFQQRFERTNALENPNPELQIILRNILTQDMLDFVNKFIEAAITQFRNMAQQPANQLRYYRDNPYQKNNDQYLYTETEDYDDAQNDSYWVVPQALRIVEPEAVLKIDNNLN